MNPLYEFDLWVRGAVLAYSLLAGLAVAAAVMLWPMKPDPEKPDPEKPDLLRHVGALRRVECEELLNSEEGSDDMSALYGTVADLCIAADRERFDVVRRIVEEDGTDEA